MNIKELNKYQTKKGNFKPEAIHMLLYELNKKPKKKKCTLCNGSGELHSNCSFGGVDCYSCSGCGGSGKI